MPNAFCYITIVAKKYLIVCFVLFYMGKGAREWQRKKGKWKKRNNQKRKEKRRGEKRLKEAVIGFHVDMTNRIKLGSCIALSISFGRADNAESSHIHRTFSFLSNCSSTHFLLWGGKFVHSKKYEIYSICYTNKIIY